MAYIVAFTGKEGAGKSTILTNLACELADAETTVGILSTDLRWQQLPVLLAGAIIRPEMSLGELFGHESLVGGFAEYSHVRNLFVSGPARGESCIEHEPPDRQQIERFMYLLSSTFDYVLIEANDLLFNQYSAITVRMCNALINVTEATELGLAFDLSNYELINAFRPDIVPINVYNNDDGDLNLPDAQKHAGHPFAYVLPYHKLVRRSSSRCMPVYIDNGATGTTITAYRKKIKAIADELRESACVAIEEQRRRIEMANRRAEERRQRSRANADRPAPDVAQRKAPPLPGAQQRPAMKQPPRQRALPQSQPEQQGRGGTN